MGNSGSSLQVPAEMPAPLQMVQLLAGFQVSQALYARAKLGVATALLAEVGTALFRSAFERWTDEPGRASFGEHVRAAAAELAASLAAAKLTP